MLWSVPLSLRDAVGLALSSALQRIDVHALVGQQQRHHRVEAEARGEVERRAAVGIRLANGALAGSSLSLARAVRNAQDFGAMTRLEAVASASLRPAKLLGIENERGTFRVGSRADFALLDAEGLVRETWLAGTRAFARS